MDSSMWLGCSKFHTTFANRLGGSRVSDNVLHVRSPVAVAMMLGAYGASSPCLAAGDPPLDSPRASHGLHPPSADAVSCIALYLTLLEVCCLVQVHVVYEDVWERRDVLGIHAQKQAGLFWVGACIPAGRLFPQDFLEFARIAERCGVWSMGYAHSG